MSTQAKHVYNFGPFRLDTKEHLLLRHGEIVHLKPKVFDLLSVLVRNSKHLLTKTDLMEMIWANSFVEEHNIAVCIFELRKALREDPEHPYIKTVSRRGYRFVSDVTLVDDESKDLKIEEFCTEGHRQDKAFETTRVKSIGILPFTFFAKEADDVYLEMGLADALITKLSNLRGITVRPTSAIRNFNVRRQDPLELARELKVTAVLEGRLSRVGNRFRVTVQLVRADEGVVLWATKFDEEFTNIFTFEDSISEQVANTLIPWLTGEETGLLEKRYTENIEVKQAYLLGQYCLSKENPKALKKGIEYFKRVTEIDPRNFMAYVGLARAYIYAINYHVFPQKEATPKIKEYILKALQLKADLSEARTLLAYFTAIYEWKWDEAGEEFKRAIELNGDCSRAHSYYSVYLRYLGRFADSLYHSKRSMELAPTSLSNMTTMCTNLYYARQYEQAIRGILNAQELDPNYPRTYFILGLSYEQANCYPEAIEAYQKSNSFFNKSNPQLLACVGRVYALIGEIRKANRLLDRLTGQPQLGYVSPYHIALIYSGLNEREAAFEWLEKAYQEQNSDLSMLKVDPRLENMRTDQRFESLLKRVGLWP